MNEVNVYSLQGNEAIIDNIKIKREWMEKTANSHAYKCFPVTLSNSLGWGISYPDDIEFIWDGISDSRPDHVKAQAFTTVISSSFYKNPMPIAWKITKPNVPILIPAGTPVVALLPIHLKETSDFVLNIYNNTEDKFGQDHWAKAKRYGEESQKINQSGEWTNFYRNATDESGNAIGFHEVKAVRMQINDTR